MLPANSNYLLHSYLRKARLIKLLPLLLGAFLFLTLTTCNQPSNTPIVDSNRNFTKVLDTANRIYEQRKLITAVHYLDSAMNAGQFTTLPQKFEHYSFNCNYYFHAKKDNEVSMLYADSMLYLFNNQQKKKQYYREYGLSLFSKGDVLFAEGKYNEAYRYLFQGKLSLSRGTNKCALGDFSYRMGMIMYKQEHYRLAAANFKNSSAETGSCDLRFIYFYRRQELLSNTGLCYSKINETDSAMMYYDMALNFINNEGAKFKEKQQLLESARGVIYGNEANIFIKQAKFQQARKLLKKSIDINLKKNNDFQDAQFSEIKLGNTYAQTGETDSLINLLHSVRKQLDSVKNERADADWHLLMANYLTRKNNPAAALQYYIKYDALKDSLASRTKVLKEADITQQIRRLEKDNEFASLKKDNIQQDIYLKVVAVFGSMLLVIFFLILRNWRKSKRNIKTLGSLNSQINNQNSNLEHALSELKHSSEEKDRILRTVAHDLRNPIGGIASLTMAMEDDDYTDEQKEMINLIKETSNNSIELINEILEATSEGETTFNRKMVEINSLLSRSVELLRFKAAEKNQRITLELLDDPLNLFISREKIWRVIGNLISNAIKFSPVGGLIQVKITENDKEAEILVIDNGIGIPSNMKQKVFNMFTEAKRAGTAGEKSFGLGLSISKQIIESHGGEIGFDSVAGNGSCFFIKIPKPVVGEPNLQLTEH